MLRRAGLAVVVLAGIGFARQVEAAAVVGPNILVAGDARIASIDANDNGMINDPEDCSFGAKTDGENLELEGMQAPGPDKLLACDGPCFGGVSVSSDFAEVTLQTCPFSGPPFVPMLGDFCSTVESCSSDHDSAVAGGAAGVGPLNIVAGEIFQQISGIRSGFGRICSAGGAAVQVTGDDGMTVLKSFVPYPNASNPTHLCVEDVPVQLASTHVFVLRTACFPIVNNAAPIALSNNPGTPIVIVNFTNLTACSTGKAPTMTDWGLIMLLVSLVGVGVWTLGRRPAFASLTMW